jgi:hypothetical protein
LVRGKIVPRHSFELPHLKGEDQAGTAENVARGIVSFAVPFVGFSKAVGVARGASWLGRAGRAMLAGGLTDFTTQDPVKVNFANLIRDTFGIDNDTLDALASEDDDNRLEARFKAAAVNAPFSLAADAVFEGGLRGVRAYRAWKGSLEEADAAVKAARADIPVSVPRAATEEAPEAVEASLKTGKGKAKATPAEDLRIDTEAKSPDDVLDFLKRKSGVEIANEELDKLARVLTEGDPENALTKLGVDPLKLDYSAFDDPELLGRLHAGLAEVYEGIAKRLGRSGIRITEEATALAARTLATTADVLKDLYGHTANLAETMYASRLFVGGHAQKLLAQAEKAIAALKAGNGEQEWLEFLESFHRHAYFLGALRGAGSEVGRALRQLQMVAKVGRKTASRTLGEAKSAADEAFVGAGGAKELAAQATDAVSAMSGDAERMAFLGRLVDKQGDIGDLSRFVRTKSGSTLKRLDAALGETRGNLFSSGTAVLNSLSGMSMLGLRALGKTFGAIGRMALSPLGKSHSQAARMQLMESWAYVDGIMGGWRSAMNNTLALLEREGMEEIALNAESLGAKGLAKKAQGLAEEGRKSLTGEFERVDISSHDRAFAMSPADLRYLNETIESWNMPALMEHGMKWLTKALAVPVNAAGTLSRLGTILFINASDQLIGTVAAKAGAQAEAMRIAGLEAGELQLEGRALTDYMKHRMVQLTETVDGFADDAYSAGRQEVVRSAGEIEAKAILFQDDLEVGAARTLAGGLSRVPIFHLFVPFVKTPLRILERTAIDFTPLGLLKDRLRADIMAGGARRDEALARIALGSMMVYSAFQLAEDRTIIGQDGDYKSSARLSRPSYTLKVGDDHFEFVRIDPVGTLLGWGADVNAYLRDQEDNPDASGKAQQLIEAAIVATQQNVLSKTWLTSLKNLTELADASSGEEFSTRLSKYTQSFAARLTPGSGIQRSIQKGIDGTTHDASTFMEATLKASLGADRLPIKRDYLLGRPVPVETGDRLFGAKVGPGASDVDDPLLSELERLSFDIPAASRTLQGVKLNSAQFNRWLELRGQKTRKDSTGLTLEESLRELIKLPEYQALPRAGRVQAIRDEMNGYSQLATRALLQEDNGFAYKVAQRQTWDKLRLEGASPEKMDAETAKFARELGITPQ